MDGDGVASWIAQVTEALVYLREEEVVHRNLKPDNLFFNRARRVQVGDFGLPLKRRKERQPKFLQVAIVIQGRK